MTRIVLTLLFGMFSFSLFAQVETTKDTIVDKEPEVLDEIILSNNILGSKFEVRNRTGSAYFLSPQDLQQFGYTDMNKVIRAVPGVSIVEEDGFGLRPNISIRGTSPERSAKITLMEDGVLIAPAPYSASSAYYFPTIGRIEDVEVLKGSSQIQYGPYTTGGAVNMVSKQIPNDFSGDVRFTYGNYDSKSTEATLGHSTENFGFVTQFFNYNSDGFKSLDGGGNTGFDKNDYLGKIRLNSDYDAKVFQSLTMKLQFSEEASNETYLGLTEDDFNANPYRRYLSSAEDKMDTEHKQIQFDYLIKPLENLKIRATAYKNEFNRNWYKLNDVTVNNKVSIGDVLETPEDYPLEYEAIASMNDTQSDVFGVKANNRSYESKGIQAIANFTFGTNTFNDLEVGLRYHEDYEDRFQWVDKYAIQNQEMIRTTVARKGSDSNLINSAEAIATYVLYKLTWNNLTITPGLRYENMTLKKKDYGKNDSDRTGVDLTTRENDVDVVIPGIGANYKFSNDLSIFGGVHRGFSPPGNQDGSDPENSTNYELGGRFNFAGITGELVGYYNDYTNLLGSDLAATGGTGSLDLFNAGAATVKGIELILNYDFLRNTSSNLRFPVTFSYTLTDTRFDSDFDSQVEIYGKVSKGDQIPYIPENQFNITASLEGNRFNLSLSGRYTDEFRTMAGTGTIPENYKIGSNFIVDAAARYFFTPRITFFTNLMNVFDSEYEVARTPAGLRPGAPFMVNGGVSYSF
ncbi:TonB-dependent receptor family protein [Namhaeicola litoreus]|uniref:TonB-dependent receptor family protein n=1 Tax=Namhaeicola litoreus TaxID=1052145 RepID=A0ABW3Y3P3_9FLAO